MTNEQYDAHNKAIFYVRELLYRIEYAMGMDSIEDGLKKVTKAIEKLKAETDSR